MSAKRYTPTISKKDFDEAAASLKAALKRKFEASKADAARPKPNPATQGAFDHVPELDSKTVARWSSVVKDHIGCKLDPRLIRKGGYDSFDDFWHDMASKLRGACPDDLGPFQEAFAEVPR
jgi:hypothetical protein